MPEALAGAAVGSMTGSAAMGSLASAGVGLLGGKGGKGGGSGGAQQMPSRIAVNGALRTNVINNAIMASDDPLRASLLKSQQDNLMGQANYLNGQIPGINAAYGNNLNNLATLLAQIKPGYGSLTDALVNTIQNAGAAAGSDLRSSLAKRRVLGSSFGDSAIAQQALDVGQKVAAAKAQGFLSELDATNQLQTQQLNTKLDQINNTTNFAINAFTDQNAATQVQLDEQKYLVGIANGLMTAAQNQAQQNTNEQLQAAKSNGASLSNFVGKGVPFLQSLFGGGGGDDVASAAFSTMMGG